MEEHHVFLEKINCSTTSIRESEWNNIMYFLEKINCSCIGAHQQENWKDKKRKEELTFPRRQPSKRWTTDGGCEACGQNWNQLQHDHEIIPARRNGREKEDGWKGPRSWPGLLGRLSGDGSPRNSGSLSPVATFLAFLVAGAACPSSSSCSQEAAISSSSPSAGSSSARGVEKETIRR
uniref:Uncharacterized protein n=1 Tax=Aegilops tauschii subsp. strangulata TaxID=200361 RepID=A0A453FTI0_AEGTS